MPRNYACRTCGRTYSSIEYESDHFCRECGTYLISGNKPSEFSTRFRQKVKETARKDRLPDSYEVRKEQMEFVEAASDALKNREVFFGSAPCGVGKSLASLLAILPRLQENRLMISFRTRSQLHIYLKELKALSNSLSAVSFFSKQDMCPMNARGILSYVDFFEECKRLKDNCESSAKPFCKFYINLIKRKREAEELALQCAQRILAPEESIEVMSRRGFCPHEALKRILSKVNVFLGTYHYVFDPKIRETIMKSFGAEFSKVFLVIDEAHNVPAFARQLLSDKLTMTLVERGIKEAENFEHKSVGSVKEILRLLIESIFEHAGKTLRGEELKRLDPQEINDLFLAETRISALEAGAILQEYGEIVKERQLKSGATRIASCNFRIGIFIESFFKNIGPQYFHMVERNQRDQISLEVRSFEGREIVDGILREARGAILMSGFLSPPNVYRDLMLYEANRTCLKEFDPPFPQKNRLILAAKDVTSEFKRRSDEMLEKWRNYVEALSNSTQGNLAVFFTSYQLMRRVAFSIETSRTMIMEDSDTKRNEVVQKLALSNNNILYGVMGGKLSEGMDYPHNLLKGVVAVGLPYATWNAYQESLVDYLEKQFPGKGRTYAYLTPAILRLVQACGRVHRSAEDKGYIAILDDRVIQPYVKRLLPSYFQKEMITVEDPSDCTRLIERFTDEVK